MAVGHGIAIGASEARRGKGPAAVGRGRAPARGGSSATRCARRRARPCSISSSASARRACASTAMRTQGRAGRAADQRSTRSRATRACPDHPRLLLLLPPRQHRRGPAPPPPLAGPPKAGSAPREGTLARTIAQIKEAGIGKAEIERFFAGSEISPVLHRPPDRGAPQVHQSIARWRSRACSRSATPGCSRPTSSPRTEGGDAPRGAHPVGRPRSCAAPGCGSVIDEVINALLLLRRQLPGGAGGLGPPPPGRGKSTAALEDRLEEEGLGQAELPAFLRMGSWIGRRPRRQPLRHRRGPARGAAPAEPARRSRTTRDARGRSAPSFPRRAADRRLRRDPGAGRGVTGALRLPRARALNRRTLAHIHARLCVTAKALCHEGPVPHARGGGGRALPVHRCVRRGSRQDRALARRQRLGGARPAGGCARCGARCRCSASISRRSTCARTRTCTSAPSPSSSRRAARGRLTSRSPRRSVARCSSRS